MANQNNNKGGQQQDVNQLLKVRREKLQNLQEAGKDPFQITKYNVCLLYTSPSPRDGLLSRMPSSA